MRFAFFILLFTVISNHSIAASLDQHFAIVFIDEATEAKFGPVPLDRRLLANTIDEIAKAGAKGVVLKFFLDQARNDHGDQSLSEIFTRIPVILQARIDNSEPSPNHFPARFALPVQTETSINGNSGWIPHPRFSGVAYDICFADYNGFPLPLLETYKGQTVKSLLLCAIELAYGEKVIIQPNKKAMVGKFEFAMKPLNQMSVALKTAFTFDYIPLHHILDTSGWEHQVKDKVVVLGYDGPRIHKISTELGDISAHRLYVHALEALLQDGT